MMLVHVVKMGQPPPSWLHHSHRLANNHHDATDWTGLTALLKPLQSLAGSLACAVSTFAASLWVITSFQAQGFISTQDLPREALLSWCTTSAVTAALVESLPVKDWDNVSVPLAVVLLGLTGVLF